MSVPGETLTILYTVDGSEPTPESAQYSSPFVLGPGTHVVSAIAVDADGESSPVSTRSYDVSAGILVTSSADSGPGSLRDALANASPGDEIRFTEDMTITLSYTDAEDRRGLEIDRDIEIDGTGRSVVIDTDGAQRHFTFTADSLFVRIANLTLRNGAPDNGGLLPGGSIYVSFGSDLTVESVRFEDNLGLRGGAIALLDFQATVTASEFISNEAWGQGGGIWLYNSSLDVVDSLLEENVAGTGGQAGGNLAAGPDAPDVEYLGGAIYNSGSTMHVLSSEFFGNGAPRDGRGAAIETTSELTIHSSAFVGNLADPAVANAGAIYTAGDTSIRYSSFAANVGASGREHIYFRSQFATYNMRNVAMDAPDFGLGASVTVDQSDNSTTSPGFTLSPEDGADNIWGTADDGYGDLTRGDSSPLIDAGDDQFFWTKGLDLDGDGDTAEDEALDAVGNPRVVGTVDIGAYERQ